MPGKVPGIFAGAREIPMRSDSGTTFLCICAASWWLHEKGDEPWVFPFASEGSSNQHTIYIFVYFN